MRHMKAISLLPLLALLAACGANSEDMKQIQESQRQILAKLNDLDKKLQQVGARPPGPQVAAVDPNKVYDLPVGASPFKGPANAPVVLTEFSDFQCPFCAQARTLVEQVAGQYPKEVKVVYKQFPLTSIHQYAMNASRAALAAEKQGKFWEMHDKLFANQRELQPEKLKEYAKDIGLDVPRFEKDMASPEVQKQIEDETKLAQQSQVNGTPTLFLNGKRVVNRSADGIKQMIDEALKQKAS